MLTPLLTRARLPLLARRENAKAVPATVVPGAQQRVARVALEGTGKKEQPSEKLAPLAGPGGSSATSTPLSTTTQRRSSRRWRRAWRRSDTSAPKSLGKSKSFGAPKSLEPPRNLLQREHPTFCGALRRLTLRTPPKKRAPISSYILRRRSEPPPPQERTKKQRLKTTKD